MNYFIKECTLTMPTIKYLQVTKENIDFVKSEFVNDQGNIHLNDYLIFTEQQNECFIYSQEEFEKTFSKVDTSFYKVGFMYEGEQYFTDIYSNIEDAYDKMELLSKNKNNSQIKIYEQKTIYGPAQVFPNFNNKLVESVNFCARILDRAKKLNNKDYMCFKALHINR